ncbi:hypothetical protein SAMN05216490_3517 [Mucilaginibacter mallensis]|uniref:Uncharacterized protein n=1 Tax=Mucilaginibacter mallensis TaxID=652787 RepID=A0A1H2AFU9_MUCMA|nr:hypothetical protein [Mucilaginibacter mallensis]SDT44794.1 hypothetical protein SAMN05216490_3517 [Mucilaginibacter mallensis]
MQHLKEFLTRIQTFDLRIIEDDIHMEWGTNEKKHVQVYDLSHQTQYYDSFSYRSELRVLKDMAFIDLMALDKERIKLQLEELSKVRERFKEFWRNYHDHHSEMTQVYERHFIFSVNLEYLFIVNGLQSTNAEIEVSSKFAEDLGESVKLREKFLRELIYATETAIKPKRSEAEFKEWLDAERARQEVATAETTNKTLITPKSETAEAPETAAVQEAHTEPELSEEQLAAAKLVGYYPTFKEGAARQLFDLLKTYFVPEEHFSLEKLLLDDEAPASPLLFRGSATQLADAFKQLKEANLIVGCRMSDLERWIAPKFLYLSPQSQPRELPEDYLNGLMSTKGRPCKSPILTIEQKEDKFFILPAPAAKNNKKMRG